MITKLSVRNFQSLRSVDLTLGPFTVIVGPSNSGKTALMRALRGLASNLRGASAITRGAKTCAITAHTDDTTIVTLERSESQGVYRITHPNGTEDTFTKLAGAVPDQVTTALHITPAPATGTSINFASQLDRPFLLDDSGANVARTLGALTNVNTILEGVREANRRRNALSATLRTRQNDLTDLTTRAAAFAGLPARLHACTRAEHHADTAATLTDRITRLRTAIDTLTVATGVLARTTVLPAIPDTGPLDAATARLHAARDLVRTWTHHTTEARRFDLLIDSITTDEQTLHGELHTTLATAGVCPTCQRQINPFELLFR